MYGTSVVVVVGERKI